MYIDALTTLAETYHIDLIAIRESDGCRSHLDVHFSYFISFATFLRENGEGQQFLTHASRRNFHVGVLGPTLHDLPQAGRINEISNLAHEVILKKIRSRYPEIPQHPFVNYYLYARITDYVNKELREEKLQLTYEKKVYRFCHYEFLDGRYLAERRQLEAIAAKVDCAIGKFDKFLNSPDLKVDFDLWEKAQPSKKKRLPQKHLNEVPGNVSAPIIKPPPVKVAPLVAATLPVLPLEIDTPILSARNPYTLEHTGKVHAMDVSLTTTFVASLDPKHLYLWKYTKKEYISKDYAPPGIEFTTVLFSPTSKHLFVVEKNLTDWSTALSIWKVKDSGLEKVKTVPIKMQGLSLLQNYRNHLVGFWSGNECTTISTWRIEDLINPEISEPDCKEIPFRCEINHIAFSPTEPLVVYSYIDNRARAKGEGIIETEVGFWTFPDFDEAKPSPFKLQNDLKYITFTPTGEDLIWIEKNGTVCSYNIVSNQHKVLFVESIPPSSLTFIKNKPHFAYISGNERIGIFDYQSSSEYGYLKVQNWGLKGVLPSYQGTELIVRFGNQVAVCKISDQEKNVPDLKALQLTSELTVNNNTRLYVVDASNKKMKEINILQLEKILSFYQKNKRVSSKHLFSNDGTKIFIQLKVDGPGKPISWMIILSAEENKVLANFEGPFNAVACSSNGKYLALIPSSEKEGQETISPKIEVWNILEMEKIVSHKIELDPNDMPILACSDTGQIAIIQNEIINLIDLQSKTQSIDFTGEAEFLEFSANDMFLISKPIGGKLWFYNLLTKKKPFFLEEDCDKFAISREGKSLAAYDGGVRFWKLEDEKFKKISETRFESLTKVAGMCFAKDNRQLLLWREIEPSVQSFQVDYSNSKVEWNAPITLDTLSVS